MNWIRTGVAVEIAATPEITEKKKEKLLWLCSLYKDVCNAKALESKVVKNAASSCSSGGAR